MGEHKEVPRPNSFGRYAVRPYSILFPIAVVSGLGPYNGFTGLERARVAQLIRWAAREGLVAPPAWCSVCGACVGPLHSHCENYYEPLDLHAICVSCHFKLHRRFRSPRPWRNLVDQYSCDGSWFSTLSLTPIDMAAALRAEFGEPVTDMGHHLDIKRFGR